MSFRCSLKSYVVYICKHLRKKRLVFLVLGSFANYYKKLHRAPLSKVMYFQNMTDGFSHKMDLYLCYIFFISMEKWAWLIQNHTLPAMTSLCCDPKAGGPVGSCVLL